MIVIDRRCEMTANVSVQEGVFNIVLRIAVVVKPLAEFGMRVFDRDAEILPPEEFKKDESVKKNFSFM